MQLDVLSIITPDPSIMAGHFLASNSGGVPSICWCSPFDSEGRMQVVYCKGFVTQSGKILADPALASTADPVIGLGPWDWMVANSVWIYQKMTERIWTNLATGKLESMTGDGVRRLPRFISYDANGITSFSWVMSRPETDYLIIDSMTSASAPYPLITKNTDLTVRNTFRGPYPGPAIGQLPAGEDYYQDYEWGGKPNATGQIIYSTHEQGIWRRGIGRYSWAAYASDGQGGYNPSPSAQSVQTLLKPMPAGLKPIQNVF